MAAKLQSSHPDRDESLRAQNSLALAGLPMSFIGKAAFLECKGDRGNCSCTKYLTTTTGKSTKCLNQPCSHESGLHRKVPLSELSFPDLALLNSYQPKGACTLNLQVLGDFSVGKKTLLTQACRRTDFSNQFKPFGIGYSIFPDLSVTYQLSTLHRRHASGTTGSKQLRGIHGFLLVYDVTDQRSFDHLPTWMLTLQTFVKTPKIVLLGNKCDLDDERVISFEAGKAVATKHGISHFEISAQTGYQVNEAISSLARLCYDPARTKPSSEYWRSMFEGCIRNHPQVHTISLSYDVNGIIPVPLFCRFLPSQSVLQTLSLSRPGTVGPDEVSHIANFLVTNTTLTSLDLSNNDFNVDCISALAAALFENSSLKVLQLRNCKIELETTLQLATALFSNSTLTMLDLSQNSINAETLAPLEAELVFNRDHIQHLSQPYLHGFPLVLPDSHLLDLRHSGLKSKLCELLPFRSQWRQVRKIDFRGNPGIVRVPRSIGHLDPQWVQELHLDPFSSPQESQYLQLSTQSLILVMRAKMLNDSSSQLKLDSYLNQSNLFLDLRGLQLDNEQAQRLPLYEPRWWNLQRIDLRQNPKLTQIPSCLGFLDPSITSRIDFDINNLMPSVRPFASSSQSSIGYAKGLLEGNLIRLNQVKLMVVGRAAVGKTTLVRSLYGRSFDPTIMSTDGIDLGEFTEGGIRFVTWDFGGQKIYRYTHQLFLSSNALYLMLFKLTDPVEESIKELRFWLNSITARTREAKVLLIGTHLDKAKRLIQGNIKQQCTAIIERLSSEYSDLLFSEHPRFFTVSCAPGGEGKLKRLRAAIFTAAKTVNVQAPDIFQGAQTYLDQLHRSPPLISYQEVFQQLKAKLPTSSEGEISSILSVLDKLGMILVFHRPRSPTGGIVVLRPQWIANLLSTIVTTKHRLVSGDSGLLNRQALVQSAWSDSIQFPTEWHNELIHLLVQLEVLFPHGSGQYFVPCMLHEDAPDLGFYIPAAVITSSKWRLQRIISLAFAVPVAVIPPLLIALMQEGELRARWQQGCIVLFQDTATVSNKGTGVWLQLKTERANEIRVAVWGNSNLQVTKRVQEVTTMIVGRITEFYHIPYQMKLQCPACRPSECSYYTYEELQQLVVAHTMEVECPSGSHPAIRVDAVAPELLFRDLESQAGFVFDYGTFKEERELGQGAFGRVLLMSQPQLIHMQSPIPLCSSSTLFPESQATDRMLFAVKLLEKKTGDQALIFQDFKHEVYLMSCLRHPNVVRLQGICLWPPAMVMEVVDGGDLYGQLNDPFGLRTKVFGFTNAVQDVVSGHTMGKLLCRTFKYIFQHRSNLSNSIRSIFQVKCAEVVQQYRETLSPAECDFLATSPLDLVGKLIKDNRIDHPLFKDLATQPLGDFYGLSEEDLLSLVPPLPQLEAIADGGYIKAQQCFTSWMVCAAQSVLQKEIESIRCRYFEALCELYQGGSTRDGVLSLYAVQDELQAISKKQGEELAPIGKKLRLKLAMDIARGMVYLHELRPPMVHRDLKTPNIFMMRTLIRYPTDDPSETEKPLAKVGDFGLSVRISSGQALQVRDREDNDLLLNINATWAAPELLSGGHYTTAVDVYAMGIMLWELLVRAHPFEEISQEAVRGSVVNGRRPTIPIEIASDASHASYIALMTLCWHHDPAQRPTMRQVYDTLLSMCSDSCRELCRQSLPSAVTPDFCRFVINPALSITSHSLQVETSFPSSTIPSGSPSITSCRVCSREYGKLRNRRTTCKSCKNYLCSSCKSQCPCKTSSSTDRCQMDQYIGTSLSTRITCMILPVVDEEVVWVGFDDGRVGMFFFASSSSLPDLQVHPCSLHDQHSLRVNCIISSMASGDDTVVIWSGAEDGSLSVWNSHLQSLENIREANFRQGQLIYFERPRTKSKIGRTAWFELENGVLTWFRQRFDTKILGTLDIAAEVSKIELRLVDVDDQIVVSTDDRQIVLSAAGSDAKHQLLEWHRQLVNIHGLRDQHHTNRVMRLSNHMLSQAGILAMIAVDHTVWCASTDFVVSQWLLTSSSDEHGLHRSKHLQVLKSVQLDSTILVPRLRTIAGFVRISDHILWLAVGNRWVNLDMAADPVGVVCSCSSTHATERDKFVALCSVKPELGSLEIWTCDQDGLIGVWVPSEVKSEPHLLGDVLKDEGWSEENGRPTCIAQATAQQVWVGTSKGRVMAIDVPSRQLIPHHSQPLPGGHSLCFSRSVYSLSPLSISSFVQSSTLIWSASSDRSLRRFCLQAFEQVLEASLIA